MRAATVHVLLLLTAVLLSGCTKPEPIESTDLYKRTRIAFVSGGGSPGPLYVMNIDGSSPALISRRPVTTFSWSPDGRKLVFMSHSDEVFAPVYVIDRDGSNEVRVGEGDEIGATPRFSPDGTRIAIPRDRVLTVRGLDGRAVSDQVGDRPVLSPDERQ